MKIYTRKPNNLYISFESSRVCLIEMEQRNVADVPIHTHAHTPDDISWKRLMELTSIYVMNRAASRWSSVKRCWQGEELRMHQAAGPHSTFVMSINRVMKWHIKYMEWNGMERIEWPKFVTSHRRHFSFTLFFSLFLIAALFSLNITNENQNKTNTIYEFDEIDFFFIYR